MSFNRVEPRSASFACCSATNAAFEPLPWPRASLFITSLNPSARKCSSIAIVRMLTPRFLVSFLYLLVVPPQHPLAEQSHIHLRVTSDSEISSVSHRKHGWILYPHRQHEWMMTS